jgi:hypothetical protein
MGKVIIDFSMIGEPVDMMQTVLREVETFCSELDKNPQSIKEEILNASTIDMIESILKREFNDELKIRDKYRGNPIIS